MNLPIPFHTSFIPSINDGILLEYRIYQPRHTAGLPTKIAAIAHPYAPLGGSFDDPVVTLVVRTLLDQGCIVGTFNMRGAGRSGGKTSWTAAPEHQDYNAFRFLLARYIQGLQAHSHQSQRHTRLTMILAGYSYGSLIASHMEPDVTAYNDSSESIKTILGQAKALVSKTFAAYNLEPRHTSVSELELNTCYLLVSPLLPPVSFFVAPFAGLLAPLTTSAQEKILTTHPTLAVYGDSDGFTSVKKYRAWIRALQAEHSSVIEAAEITSAGHFWREDNVDAQLAAAIAKWSDSLAATLHEHH